ncbi:MAG: hypothetical protein AB7J32_08525 [Pseudonocardia sp.]
MSSATQSWRADYLAGAVEAALLRGRLLNQAALVATGSATEADVRRLLEFWMVQRGMPVRPEHRVPANVRTELAGRVGATAVEGCGCDREPPSGQELSAV